MVAPEDEPGEFTDHSGTLKALQRRLESEEAAQRAWVDYLATEVLNRPAFTNLQAWTIEALHRVDSPLTSDTSGIQDREFSQRLEGAVRGNHLFMPQVSLHHSETAKAAWIQFEWPCYGLVVGPADTEPTIQAPYVTNAAPGIYAYHLLSGNVEP